VSALIGRKLIETRIEGKGVVAAAVAVVVENTRFLIVIICKKVGKRKFAQSPYC